MAGYVLENCGRHFREAKYHGIYLDDGIVVFPGKWRVEVVAEWLSGFQRSINRLLDSEKLKFTATLWRMNEPEVGTSFDKVSVCTDIVFPYLDMALLWSNNGNLQFSAFCKPNQQLKYLNSTSNHSPATFKAIPHGVALRLALLTTVDESNKDKSISDLHPAHFSALKSAGLCSEPLPSVGDVIEKHATSHTSSHTKKAAREKASRRQTFFCVGFSTIWRHPIHKTISKLRHKYKLTWLRPSMSYHVFSNLGAKLNADTASKLMAGIDDLTWITRPCNCGPSFNVDGQ